MIFDLMIVAVLTAILTVLTARKNEIFSHLKRNSITAGVLLTVIQLMIFITKLDYSNSDSSSALPDFNRIMISVLIKFRPLLISILLEIVFSVIENVKSKNEKTGASPNQKQEEPATTAEADFSLLSRREKEVARLAAKGYTNAQIAEALFISTETVKSHMNSIFEKLGISSRKELLAGGASLILQ